MDYISISVLILFKKILNISVEPYMNNMKAVFFFDKMLVSEKL